MYWLQSWKDAEKELGIQSRKKKQSDRVKREPITCRNDLGTICASIKDNNGDEKSSSVGMEGVDALHMQPYQDNTAMDKDNTAAIQLLDEESDVESETRPGRQYGFKVGKRAQV